MTDFITYLKMLSAFLCSLATYLWGGIDTVFCVLLSLIAIDYITGILAGIKTKTLSSEVGFFGILKKIGILCVVALSHFIGDVSGMPEIRSLVIGFYIANEGISILENTGRLGVLLPKKLIDILSQLKEGDE